MVQQQAKWLWTYGGIPGIEPMMTMHDELCNNMQSVKGVGMSTQMQGALVTTNKCIPLTEALNSSRSVALDVGIFVCQARNIQCVQRFHWAAFGPTHHGTMCNSN